MVNVMCSGFINWLRLVGVICIVPNCNTSLDPRVANGYQKILDKYHTSQVAHQDGIYLGFRSMKRLGVFLLLHPPEWDASPSQGYPQCSISRYPFIHLAGERHCDSKVFCPKTQHNVPGQGSNPNSSIASRKYVVQCEQKI